MEKQERNIRMYVIPKGGRLPANYPAKEITGQNVFAKLAQALEAYPDETYVELTDAELTFVASNLKYILPVMPTIVADIPDVEYTRVFFMYFPVLASLTYERLEHELEEADGLKRGKSAREIEQERTRNQQRKADEEARTVISRAAGDPEGSDTEEDAQDETGD